MRGHIALVAAAIAFAAGAVDPKIGDLLSQIIIVQSTA
jgi:hypothetical protein